MSSDPIIREIRRKTRIQFTAERKIEIVLEGVMETFSSPLKIQAQMKLFSRPNVLFLKTDACF